MKRVPTRELLDDDLGTPEEIRDTLLDLRGFNRRFGGFESIATLFRTVAKSTQCRSLTFLDVAGGAGDVAESVACDLLTDCIDVHATVLDRAASHMNGQFSLNRVAGDALALPFADGSFHVVGCNLFLHHLQPEEMLTFFNEALRVARLAVIASDLRRNLFHWAAAYAGRIRYRSRLTRNDAPASVRQAYTIEEIDEIANQTPAAGHDISPCYFQRFGLILWKA
jgi:2-polyprenyl-3-methyl-5-hydroxy-6-metoxy-1,4-benzoquinol methylase